MNINQIKYFVSVVDHGSFSSAATKHGISAQGVSKTIADLEAEIETQLLTRNNRGVVPTEFGLSVYDRAKRVLNSFNSLDEFAHGHAGVVDTTDALRIAICTPLSYGKEKARKNMIAFINDNLDVDVTISFGRAKGCLAALQAGSSDTIITFGRVNTPATECVTLGTIPCGLLVSHRHPLAKKKYVCRADLEGYPIALPPGFDFFNDELMTYCKAHKNAPILKDIKQTLKGFVLHITQMQGMVLLPHIPFLGDEVFPGTITLALAPQDAIPTPLCLVHLKQKKTPPVEDLQNLLTMR